jgi:hypothetical protein
VIFVTAFSADDGFGRSCSEILIIVSWVECTNSLTA